jgi:hypothetical protein
LAVFDLKQYARRGAAQRVAELNEELAAIYRAFPDLRQGLSRQGRRTAGKTVINHEGQVTGPRAAAAASAAAPSSRRKRRKMSAAERKAVSLRMQKYWAGRKQGKAR